MQKQGYRSDIDGLRAIAVLSVVIFHFNNDWLPSGFVGVDIFFVISGFLITGIIHKEIEAGDFSFYKFFMRRVRRILPAALVVTLATLAVGIAFMLPADSASLARSALYSSLSVANIYFWLYLDTGYFATSTDMVPLLHMWSLGVEEQFYLLWPPIMLILYKLGGARAAIAFGIVAGAASFWFGQSMLSSDPKFAYYMLPSRAGELLVGCMTFLALRNVKGFQRNFISNTLSLVGIGLLVASFFIVDQSKGFPGYISLLPTLAAALIIASGSVGNSVVGYLISLRPMVWVGLVSFSLYLWHWPILAFYRYAYGDPSFTGGVICLALMALLSYASFRYVETPFRKHGLGKVKSPAFVGVIGVVVLTCSGFVYSKGGYVNQSYADKVAEMEEITKAAPAYPYVCQSTLFNEDAINDPRCVFGGGEHSPNVILYGDSNAAHYAGYLKKVSEHLLFTIRNIEHSSCVPFIHSSREFSRVNHDSCEAFNDFMMKEVLNYESVIIGASWNANFGDRERFEEEFRNTIRYLSNNVENVVVAKKIPVFGGYDRQCAQKAIKIPFMNCAEGSRVNNDGQSDVNDVIDSVLEEFDNVYALSIREEICDGEYCQAYLKETPVYYNPGHLSLLGSELLGEKVIREDAIPEAIYKIVPRDI